MEETEFHWLTVKALILFSIKVKLAKLGIINYTFLPDRQFFNSSCRTGLEVLMSSLDKVDLLAVLWRTRNLCDSNQEGSQTRSKYKLKV